MHVEGVQVRVEVEDDGRHLLVVLDRRTDSFLTPWQDAYSLAETLDSAIDDIKPAGDSAELIELIDPASLRRESNQVRLGTQSGLVGLFFDWTDRLRFSWRSASLFRDALKKVAQDAQLAERKIFLEYDRRGMVRKLHNNRVGYVQHIPGR